MLSSIHPLGERARHNRWGLTVSSFVIAAVVAGGAAGAVLGGVGSLLPDGSWRWVAALGVIVAAGGLDLAGVAAPGPRRQVNEDWIGTFRGWVYGAGFGGQLGVGVATFVVTWGVWATGALALLTASATAGAAVGAVFGMGRSLAPLAAGWIDRPSRLTAFNRAMADRAHLVSRTVAFGLVTTGVVGSFWSLT